MLGGGGWGEGVENFCSLDALFIYWGGRNNSSLAQRAGHKFCSACECLCVCVWGGGRGAE